MRLILEVRYREGDGILDENGSFWRLGKDGTVSATTDTGGSMVAEITDGGMGEDDGPEVIVTDKASIQLYFTEIS